jgi:hypothetical protein
MRATVCVTASVAIGVAGCASNWTRPNTTEAQFRQDVYACQQQAAAAPRPVYVQPTQSARQTDCTAQGNNLSCTTRPGVDTAMYANAANAHAATAAQPAAIDACLMARGYRRG